MVYRSYSIFEKKFGLKGKGVDLSQGPLKRKRDVVQIHAVIKTPMVPTENVPSSSRWDDNVVLVLNFMISFFRTIFSRAFTSYMLKLDFSFLFFLSFGC